MEAVDSVVAEETDLIDPLNPDVTALDEDLAAELIDQHDDEKTGAPSLPVIGYVPGYDPTATRVDLVADTPPPSDQNYVAAMKAERAEHPEQALKLIRETLGSDSTHWRAKLALGRLLFKTGQYQAAKSHLLDITSERTDDWRPWFWLGSSYLLLKELRAAEAAFDEALARDSKVAEIWVHRALVAQELNDWRTAMQLLNIAAELAPNHPMVMLNIGITSEAIGRLDNARAAYRKFLTESHRNKVSNVIRYEVINHLSSPQIADVDDNTDQTAPDVLSPIEEQSPNGS